MKHEIRGSQSFHSDCGEHISFKFVLWNCVKTLEQLTVVQRASSIDGMRSERGTREFGQWLRQGVIDVAIAKTSAERSMAIISSAASKKILTGRLRLL